MTQVERVAVFGAGGAVGRAILDGLTDPHLSVVPCLRQVPAGGLPDGWRVADARDERAVRAALEGCNLAVNAVGGPPATLVAATRAICRAAQKAGLRRVVHLSSLAVYAARPGTADENWPLEGAPRPYAAAKIACEAVLRDCAAHGSLEGLSLRAGLVFGRHSRQWAGRMARLLHARRLGDLGADGDGFCNLTHEADLGHAVRAALLAGSLPPALNVCSREPPTWNGFFEMFARALGLVPLRRIGSYRLQFEARALAPALHIARLAARRIGQAGLVPDPITPSLAQLFALRLRLDGRLADRVLAMPRSLDRDAIRAQAAWMRAS